MKIRTYLNTKTKLGLIDKTWRKLEPKRYFNH